MPKTEEGIMRASSFMEAQVLIWPMLGRTNLKFSAIVSW